MSQPSTCGLHASFAITVSRPSRSDDLEQPAQQLLARESPTAASASTAATISSSDRSSTDGHRCAPGRNARSSAVAAVADPSRASAASSAIAQHATALVPTLGRPRHAEARG